MDRKHSNDPRSIRARRALHEALKALLQEKPFAKITVTNISSRSGLSRHTFYNHYETKEDLLNSLIDSILDEFFADVGQLNNMQGVQDDSGVISYKFFQIWQENADLVRILKTVDMERLLLDRLKALFAHIFFERLDHGKSQINKKLAEYIININAHSVAAVLEQWIEDDMKYPPEVMGSLLNHLANLRERPLTIEKFNHQIR